MLLTSLVFNLFLFRIRGEDGGERETLQEITGLLCQLENCQHNLPWAGWTSHTSLQSELRTTILTWSSELRGLSGPALFKHIQTGIMSILLQKTMDKISNLCLGTHKNKWKLGISLAWNFSSSGVCYRSQVQYIFSATS